MVEDLAQRRGRGGPIGRVADGSELVGGAVTDEAQDAERTEPGLVERPDRDEVAVAVTAGEQHEGPVAAEVPPPRRRPLPGAEHVVTAGGQRPPLGLERREGLDHLDVQAPGGGSNRATGVVPAHRRAPEQPDVMSVECRFHPLLAETAAVPIERGLRSP